MCRERERVGHSPISEVSLSKPSPEGSVIYEETIKSGVLVDSTESVAPRSDISHPYPSSSYLQPIFARKGESIFLQCSVTFQSRAHAQELLANIKWALWF